MTVPTSKHDLREEESVGEIHGGSELVSQDGATLVVDTRTLYASLPNQTYHVKRCFTRILTVADDQNTKRVAIVS